MTQEGISKLDKRRRILAIVKLIVLAVILIGVPLYIYFFQHDLIERFSDIKELENTLRSYRKESMLIYVGCQILQVVLSVIPGQALQFAGGYLYGALLGLILSIIGIGIGSTLAYYIARLLGRDAIHLFFGKRKVTEMLDLMNSPKGLIVTFVIFLIPGIPKDLCSYAAGISNSEAPSLSYRVYDRPNSGYAGMPLYRAAGRSRGVYQRCDHRGSCSGAPYSRRHLPQEDPGHSL